MKKRLSVGELFDIMEAETTLLIEKTEGNENIKNIKAVSLLLEERVKQLSRRANSNRRIEKKPEIVESRTETCVCGQPWVYEDTFFGRVFGRCRDEYCFINAKSQR